MEVLFYVTVLEVSPGPEGGNIKPAVHIRLAKGKISALIYAFCLISGPRETDIKAQCGLRTKIVASLCPRYFFGTFVNYLMLPYLLTFPSVFRQSISK